MTAQDQPLPQTGGAYIRDKDGKLVPDTSAAGEATTSPPTSKKDKN